MKKDRFVAFFDAVMAIIMTIAVLQFEMPEGTKWTDLRGLGFQILVYALSFFWLGMMWISIHNLWNDVEYVSRGVLIVNLCMLFFSSMIPFLVTYVGRNFHESVPQLLYGIAVVCVTVCNQLSLKLIKRHNPQIAPMVKSLRKASIIDLVLKAVGIVIGLTVYPPAIMFSTLIAVIVLVVNYLLMKRSASS